MSVARRPLLTFLGEAFPSTLPSVIRLGLVVTRITSASSVASLSMAMCSGMMLCAECLAD